jgi:hypothetical protein
MKELFKNPKFRNPLFWTSLVAIIFGAAGISFETLTSWALMGAALMSIVENPVAIMAVIVAVIGVFNNNDTKGIDKIKVKNEE